jgi:hypothetical protein
MRQIVPCYTWSGDDTVWAQRLAEVNPGDMVVVTGPNSGPPATRNERDALAPRIAELRHGRKAVVLGYVALDYGDRPIADVALDIDRWAAVDVARIFFDEMSSTVPAPALAAMLARSQGARFVSPGGTSTVLNPGVPWPHQCPPDTVIVTHERTYAAGLPTHLPKPWEACIVHSCPVHLVDRVRDRLAASWRWVYVTADGRTEAALGLPVNAFDEATKDDDA